MVHHEDDEDQYRNAVLDPQARLCGELDAAAGVGLCQELVPALSVAARAEQHEHQRAERQHVVGDDEVLDGLDVADAGDGHPRQHVEPQRAVLLDARSFIRDQTRVPDALFRMQSL